VLTKVEDSANNSLNWAEVGVTTACEANDLAAYSIFLVGESKGGKSGLLYLFAWSCSDVDSGIPNKELDVFKAEWILIVVSVLSRSQ
jgi:hypothetical protein